MRQIAKPFLPWVGGKHSLLPYIFQLLPRKAPRLLEVCGGSGAVTLGLGAGYAPLRVYNDLNADLANLFRCTRDRPLALLKELGAKYVVSRAERDVQAKFLLRNGADAVAYPEKQLAKWAAIRYTANHIFSYIELDEQHAIIEVAVPEDWQGRSIGELDIRRKYGVNILGVKRNGKTDVNISPETVLDGDLTLLVLGENQKLKKHFRL